MKKTIHVNIGGMPFVVDEDAYQMLRHYLNEIEIRLDGIDSKETMQDIETRIADIFTGAITPQVQVVDRGLVQRMIGIIGRAQEFGEPRRSLPREECTSGYPRKRLMRSRRDKMIGGVCGGIANYANMDVSIIRVLWVLCILCVGFGLLAYIVLWIAIPMEPADAERDIQNGRW